MTRNLFAALLLGSLSLFITGCDGQGGVGRSSANLAQGEACQAKGQCGPGLECEIEHGVGSCQPHAAEGQDDNGQDVAADDKGQGADDPRQPGGGAPLPIGDCTVDADCGPGEQCEIEHGAGTCVVHAGKK